MKNCMIMVALICCISATAGPKNINMNLWDGAPPNSKGEGKEHIPTLTSYHVKGTNVPAVLICPGGGYKHISGHRDLAKWYNAQGISVFALRYRLPVHGYQHPIPLNDAQRAMRIIRSNAKKWNLDSKRIGVMGFSSGGRLASTLMTHYDAGNAKSEDPIERASCKPDWAMLMCPVITFGKFAHRPSHHRLIGRDASAELVKKLSNELQVTAQTPPTFLAHCKDDGLVKPENSQLFNDALVKAKVKCELKLYPTGGHGLRGKGREYLWLDDGRKWLLSMKIIAK